MAEKNFRETLNLPRTDFPMRASANESDPKMLERWANEDINSKIFECNKGKEKFIFHFGPPYANGHIHVGHAYTTILKDILCKSQRMSGKQVPVTPGWDCHGLPIELKVTQEYKNQTVEELKANCRAYAGKWVEIQREEFKKLGIFFDWDNPYLTMDYGYEAGILKAFGEFVDKGYIERKNKTVTWCSSCETVLASAEIEYKERKDPSIYVLFELDKLISGKKANLLVWTTTPWTLPLNRAVVLKPGAIYQLLESNGMYFIIGKELSDQVCQKLGIDKKVISEFPAEEFHGAKLHHPFIKDLLVPILLDQSVLLTEGTACVHTAPGCGPEDYEIGIKNNLEIFSPISTSGKYTEEIKPKELLGMSVTDAQGWVIKKLEEEGRLLHKSTITHSYPHCWRCLKPLIFRATKQYFCNLAHKNLKSKALEAIKKIKFHPNNAYNHMKAALESRLEWCLSRQRNWGVPITFLLCKNCDHALINKNLIEKVSEGIKKEGIEYWDRVDISSLLPNGFMCPLCKGVEFKKEKDILDVWFDSGVSHYNVLKGNKELGYPADAYLEGIDQYRGWFQSSLLTSLVLEDEASMRMIISHGYTVDAKGQKMSKSLGNVVTPEEMIRKLGTDGLRLWVSSINFDGDAIISETLLSNVSEVYRKIRNTCRFLIANLYDFEIEKDAIETDKMLPIDQYALIQLKDFDKRVRLSYQSCDFTGVFHELGNYCTSDLSSFYLDIIKDRLYVELSYGHKRRSAQTMCWYILDTITRLMAPILSFTAEQLSDYYQHKKQYSIHLQNFADLSNLLLPFNVTENLEQWKILKEIRSEVLKALEVERAKGIIKHSLDAMVTLYFDESMKGFDSIKKFLAGFAVDSSCTVYCDSEKFDNQKKFDSFLNFLAESMEITDDKNEFFKEFFIISQFKLEQENNDLPKSDYEGLFIKVEKASDMGEKCLRCWQWRNISDEGLCARCAKILNESRQHS